ncbi:SPOR domain-containing protein [Yoonia sp. SS1-5]|uniref:SPOR domain-containing protein n=1 Tax=Yoonia rhodophyticola TaxID=3137370 RepID=A0AAN0M6A9_9RHOB
MAGYHRFQYGTLRYFFTICAGMGLAACDEDGNFAFPTGDEAAEEAPSSTPAPLRTRTTDEDVERPDVFSVSDRGLWDGRPSLGGVWVAHPDVTDPERVIIRNPDNGQSVIGALFRRERENPGPLLQVSSDAAEALGVLAGAPTELSVVALRREEVVTPVAPGTEENPVVADLDTAVAATPAIAVAAADAVADTDPIANAAAAIDAADAAVAPVVATALPAVTADVSADAETPPPPPAQAPAVETVAAVDPGSVQIGVFSVEVNANSTAQDLTNAGIPTSVIPQQSGGRTVWRVISPPGDDAARTLDKIKALGFVDAFAIDS